MARPCVSVNSSNLTILGVIHQDKEVAPLLVRWLQLLRPEVITLEFSHFGLKYRETQGEERKRRVQAVADGMASRGLKVDRQSLDAVLRYLEPPLEFTVSSAHARLNRCPLYLIDDDRFSRPRLAAAQELVSAENLEKLLSGPPQNDCRHQRALADLCLNKGVSLYPYTKEMETRDRRMRDRLVLLMQRHPGARLVHICGWQHLRDPHGVYDVLDPKRAFVYDETFCI